MRSRGGYFWRRSESGRARTAVLMGIAALLFLGSVVAVLAGGVTPRGTQPPLVNEIIAPTGNCSSCHGDFTEKSNHEPYPTWAGSMMANSSRDPLFWAALDVANNDVAGVGDYCLRCHVPSGWYSGRSEPPLGSEDGCMLQGEIDGEGFGNDFEGVSCHLCHRSMVNEDPPPGESGFYLENGELWIDDGECAGKPCRRGPYDYPPGIPPPHAWAYSPLHRTGDFCGTCHNVTSPTHTLIDENGVDTGLPFPIERTHREWTQSAYAPAGNAPATCQSCHMPMAAGAQDVYACFFNENDRAGDLRTHQFVGGNTWVPEVLKGEYPNLQRDLEFDATIAWANEMLDSAAAVALTAPASDPDRDLAVSVRVTNLSGHKLPTGYTEGRRMWLQVRARDADGTLVFESGAYDAATAVLTEDAQAKIYRAEPGIWNGTLGICETDDAGGDRHFHFVLNDCIRIDNRIPPLGFTGGTDLETRPVGYSYPETSPGSGVLVNHDDTPYAFVVPVSAKSPIQLEVRLFYQTTSKEYVEFLLDQALDNGFPDDCIPRIAGNVDMSRAEVLHDMWTRYGRSAPVEMDLVSAQIVVARLFVGDFETGSTSQWSSTVP